MMQLHPLLRRARFIVIPENNLAFEAMHLESEIRARFDPDDVICFRSDSNKAGVRTDNLLKRGMANGLNQLLETETLHFWSDFMSFNARVKNASALSRRLAEENMRDDIVKEIRSFLKITRPQKDPTRPPVIQYTGKMYGGFDDTIIALMLANTGRRLFFALEEYADYH